MVTSGEDELVSPTVTIRAETNPDDERFLLKVYDSTRRSELNVLGWSKAESDAFIKMQFDAQCRHYRSWYPRAIFSVILVSGEPAGRLIVDRSEGGVLIVDLAILPEYQRAGVGSRVVHGLLDEALATGSSVRCQVELGNPARSFWEQLGFTVRGINGAHLSMECDARPI
jgi:GNAT superfamily N-acetyltransferase